MLDLNASPDALASVHTGTKVDLTTDSTKARTLSSFPTVMGSVIHEAIDDRIVLRRTEAEDSKGSLEPASSGCDGALSIIAQALSKPHTEQLFVRGEACTLKDLSEDDSGTSISSVVNATTMEAVSPEFEASSQGSAENE
eukprot:c43318_g1_i1 orf=1-417(-)